ncbi:hypothetical protein ACVWXQ_009484 [Bradyrhizobium sp. S3.14.4]
MRRRLLLVMAAFALFTAPAFADQKIKVGISGGDAEIIWAKVKEIAAKDGLDVQVVVFNDYLLPNAALDVGDLDANAFQHKPFLDTTRSRPGDTRSSPSARRSSHRSGSIPARRSRLPRSRRGRRSASPTIRRTVAGPCGCFRPKS